MVGIFTHTHAKLLEILAILDSNKSEIGQSRLPALSVTWELNERFAELTLFGQYASRVFYKIIKK